MSVAVDPFFQIEKDIVDRLNSDTSFAEIPVLARAKGNLLSDIEAALKQLNTKANGKIGLVVIVLAPVADVPYPDVPGPYLELIVTVRIVEQPLLNTIGVSAGTAAKLVMENLHQWTPGSSGSPLFVKPRAMEPYLDPEDPDLVGWDILLGFKLGLDQKVKTLPVLITKTGDLPEVTVTMTCAEGGAVIYYTTDGSLPTPTNGATYATPFTQASAATIRAAAYLDGKTGSDINQLEIN